MTVKLLTNEEVADVLDRAHDDLLLNGWCQGQFVNDDGAHCAMGALAHVCSEEITTKCIQGFGGPVRVAAVHALAMTLHNVPAVATFDPAVATFDRDPASTVVMWNDCKATTEDDVLDMFRHASKNLRNQGQP